MKNRLMMFCALLGLTCMVALGADIDGKWTRENQGKDGKTTVQTLTLKADGSKLTGNLDGGRGGPVEISEGMVMGKDVMFKITRAGRDGTPTTTTYKGTLLSGDTLKLSFDNGRGPQDQEFKKAK
jgi:hypothetical protein